MGEDAGQARVHVIMESLRSVITKHDRARAVVLLLETAQRRRTTITTAVLRVGLLCRAERLEEADPVLDAAVHQVQQSGYQVLHAGCL